MAEDFINYGALIDEAMHIIVKKSLEIAASKKLPGEHHFFISFITKFPGVNLSDKLRKKYPQEMTIVLQFQFEELKVEETSFSVVLSFDNVKEKVIVPFAAITAFADPSVKFGLQFRHIDEQPEEDELTGTDVERHTGPITSGKPIKEIIKESGATNVITLDSFRKKHD
jgi:hypothetical protein